MTTYHGGRNDTRRGEICAMTMGEKVSTWNVFRWGGEGSAWNVPTTHLPLDAQEWLRARR